jgi:hypothetical protein
MNSMRRRGWARAFADAAVLIGALFPIASGCATAEVNPRYESLKPSVVAVLPVENATIHQLDAVAFGGLLQRGIIGPEVHDIPALLRAGLEESLLLAGYATSSGAGGVPAGAGRPPQFEATLLATIESWWASTVGTPAFSMRYRVEMHHVESGEVLYRNLVESRAEEDPRARSADLVPAAIRRSARRALAELPPR